MRYLIALLFLVSSAAPARTLADQYLTYSTRADFADVVDNVRLAIENRGMYINNVLHLSDMLERTGKDLGDTRQVYLRAESIEFCSAVLSRRMLQEDPRRIVNCPFIISVYVLPAEPDTTYIAHRRLAGEGATGIMRELMDMLQAVAREGLEGW